jgi:hypothetical protein
MEVPGVPLPPELRQVLLSQGGEPLRLVDDQTQKVYLLVSQDSFSPVDDGYLRQLILEAREDVARGDVAPWDVDEIRADARRELAERQAKPH